MPSGDARPYPPTQSRPANLEGEVKKEIAFLWKASAQAFIFPHMYVRVEWSGTVQSADHVNPLNYSAGTTNQVQANSFEVDLH